MKIRRLTPDGYPKAAALLRQAFPEGDYETRLFANLHANNRNLHEWICIHRNKAIAYIAYSNAYRSKKICGLHLAPLAVTPDMQGQGIGSELLRFSLRQKEIKAKTLFVFGNPDFYQRFGFTLCAIPRCPFDENNRHFLSIRNEEKDPFTVGYEPEFMKHL